MNTTTVTTTTTTETVSTVTYKDVPGYPGYRVGDDASVWSQKEKAKGKGVGRCWVIGSQWHRLKPKTDRKGYHRLVLSHDHKRHEFLVHQIVMLAFVGPCPAGLEIRHLDGNSLHNRPGNLVYGTRLENIRDKARHGTQSRGESHGESKLTNLQVLDIKKRLAAGEFQYVIARDYGVVQSTIGRIGLGKSWKHLA